MIQGALMNARYEKIAELRSQDISYRDIGAQLGVSRERVRQIFKKEEFRKNRPITWKDGLPTRVKNSLSAENICSREELLVAVESGKLSINTNSGSGTIYGIGRLGISKIYSWLGLSPPVKQKKEKTILRAIELLRKHGYSVTQTGGSQ